MKAALFTIAFAFASNSFGAVINCQSATGSRLVAKVASLKTDRFQKMTDIQMQIGRSGALVAKPGAAGSVLLTESLRYLGRDQNDNFLFKGKGNISMAMAHVTSEQGAVVAFLQMNVVTGGVTFIDGTGSAPAACEIK
jgi:hypothetical protein